MLLFAYLLGILFKTYELMLTVINIGIPLLINSILSNICLFLNTVIFTKRFTI